MFVIKSTRSDRALAFSNLSEDGFDVSLEGIRVSASMTVYTYTDANGLNKLFQELAALERPWHDEKKWKSIEGDFR